MNFCLGFCNNFRWIFRYCRSFWSDLFVRCSIIVIISCCFFFVIASFNVLALCVWAWHRITTANVLAKPIQLCFNFFSYFIFHLSWINALLFRYEHFAWYQNDHTHTVTFSAIFVVQISLLCHMIMVWTILSLPAHKHISTYALQLCLCVFWFY